MVTRSRLLGLAVSCYLITGCFLVTSERVPADDVQRLDLGPLAAELRNLVEKYYPKVEVTLQEQTIHFEFNTRRYMIHNALLTGEWLDAREETGPQRGGIYGDIKVHRGNYGGQAMLPQSFDVRYFVTLARAPYSKQLDRHLYVQLKYPHEASKEFVIEFSRLTDDFEKYIPAKK